MDSVEYGLLLQSHGDKKARDLLKNRYSVFGDQKPFLIFHDGPKTDHAANRVSAAQRRKQARNRASFSVRNLREFLRDAPKDYDAYKPLRKLWQGYILEVLGTEADPRSASAKMAAADWVGAEIKIKASKCPSLVGQAGTVVWEGKDVIILAGKDGRVRQVPKAGTLWQFEPLSEVPQSGKLKIEQIHIVGPRMRFRSADRATRKFKSHSVSDIQTLFGV